MSQSSICTPLKFVRNIAEIRINLKGVVHMIVTLISYVLIIIVRLLSLTLRLHTSHIMWITITTLTMVFVLVIMISGKVTYIL